MNVVTCKRCGRKMTHWITYEYGKQPFSWFSCKCGLNTNKKGLFRRFGNEIKTY